MPASRRLRAALYGAAACALLSAAPAFAQVALEVALRDAGAGGPAAGVPVRIVNLDTGASFEGVSDARGRVRFGGLSTAGTWQVIAEGGPYGGEERSAPLALRSGFDRSITLLLGGEAIEELVIVGSRAITGINRLNAEVSATFKAEQIERLPVEGRSLDRVLFRLPTVTQSTGFFNEAPSIAINGANSLFTNYMIDGLDNNENFLGGQKFPVPVGMVQDVTVLASNYSAEFGRTANGVVNVTTKSGGNDFDGEVFFVTRPGGFLSKETGFNPRDLSGNLVSEDFERYQTGFALGGPIVRDRTFFFVNAEYTRDRTTNRLVAPELGVAETISGENDFLLLTGKIDHHWTPGLVTSLRANVGRVELERPGGGISGGVTFPSAGSEQTRDSTNVALTTTWTEANWDYSGSVQYSRFEWDFGKPLNPEPGPQVNLLDPSGRTIATLGHPGFVFDEREKTFQTQHKLNLDIGRHALKFGTDIIVSNFALAGGGNVDGNFQVQLDEAQLADLLARDVGRDFNVADLPADAAVLQALFETQPNRIGATQRTYSLWAEDRIQVAPELVVTLGLRWEFDNLSKGGGKGDFDNIAPRASANWSFRDDMVLRGGIGLFYEKVPYAVVSDALQFSSTSPGFKGQIQTLIDRGILPADTDIDRVTNDGNLAVNVADLCTGLGQCPDPQSVFDRRDELTLAELRIANPDGLDNPYALQMTLGWQWQIDPVWQVALDGIWSEGRNLVRLVDLNAPAPFAFNQAAFDELGPEGVAALTSQEREALGLVRSAAAANLTRPALNPDGSIPAGGARSIVMSDTGGRSRYRALIVTLEKERGRDVYDLFLSYTLSKLANTSDDINFRANDANDFAADRGASLNDRRHVLSTLANVYPAEWVTLSVTGLFQSGQPVNLVPDGRVFGTTDLNGDGLSFADQFTGNPDRLPGVGRNSERLSFSTTIDLGAAFRVPLGGDDEIELRTDFFNVFNANNESGFPVNFTASNQIQTGGAPFVQRSAAPGRTFQLSARYLF